MLFVFGDITFLSSLCSIMHGIFAIIKRKATKLRIEKMPATIYSWNTALTVNVISRQIYAFMPDRLQGK